MFGLFKKKVDLKKVNTFCDWFISKNEEIIESVNNSEKDHMRMMILLDEVEAQLKLVYNDHYNGRVEFEYGFDERINKWELRLFHLNNKCLISATSEIAKVLNEKLGDTWVINIDK